jgi:hypothetical protein
MQSNANKKPQLVFEILPEKCKRTSYWSWNIAERSAGGCLRMEDLQKTGKDNWWQR